VESGGVKKEGEKAMRVRWISLVQVLILVTGLKAAETESALDARAAKHFRVRWMSVEYNKSVVAGNPETSQTWTAASEALTLTCQVEIRDPDLVIGLGRDGIITEMRDAEGQPVTVPVRAGRRYQTMYDGLNYGHVYRPPKVSRWQTILQSIARRVPLGPIVRRAARRPGPAQLVMELQASQITMHLDKGLLAQNQRELRSVKGYFYALMAGAIENVDVPFEPNDKWVRLTPELEVQVKEAACTGGSYRYWIETRPPRGGSTPPPLIGRPLPTRLVAARQFLGADGKPDFYYRSGAPGLMLGGRGSGGAPSPIKAIRFVIAVNPTERKIPFELSHVPLPNPQEPSRTAGE
jgi:hypothetical protein